MIRHFEGHVAASLKVVAQPHRLQMCATYAACSLTAQTTRKRTKAQVRIGVVVWQVPIALQSANGSYGWTTSDSIYLILSNCFMTDSVPGLDISELSSLTTIRLNLAHSRNAHWQ